MPPVDRMRRWRRQTSQVKCCDLFVAPDVMPLSHQFLKLTRAIHLYLGVFTAPMLLFFAITGGLQTFGLHESERGSSYKPPAWLATMAQLHKKQTVVMPVPRLRPVTVESKPSPPVAALSAATAPRAMAAAAKRSTQEAKPGLVKNLWPMKVFFAIVAFGLLVSVLSGLYMAWRYSRKPRLFGAIFAAGMLVPLLLLLV